LKPLAKRHARVLEPHRVSDNAFLARRLVDIARLRTSGFDRCWSQRQRALDLR